MQRALNALALPILRTRTLISVPLLRLAFFLYVTPESLCMPYRKIDIFVANIYTKPAFPQLNFRFLM